MLLTNLAMRLFVNKPTENYEGLRVICSEDNATDSYATYLFLNFRDRYGNVDNNNDNEELAPVEDVSDEDGDANSAPSNASSPPHHQPRGPKV